MRAIKKTILLVMIPAVLLVATAFMGKSVGSGGIDDSSEKIQCNKESQNNWLVINNFKLHFNLNDKMDRNGNSYSNWMYNNDINELWVDAHNNFDVQITSSDYTQGIITSFDGIMECYERYKNIDKNRVPSVSVTYNGSHCLSSFSVNYFPNDFNHKCSYKTLIGVPLISPIAIETGILSIQTIKTKTNGLRLKWEQKIESNDLENLDQIMKSNGEISNSGLVLKQLSLNAAILSSTLKNTIAFRKLGVPTKSSVSEMIAVENTIPQDLSGKQVAIRLSENPEVIAPQLSGRVYMNGKYRTDVEWDSPLLYEVIEK